MIDITKDYETYIANLSAIDIDDLEREQDIKYRRGTEHVLQLS